MSTQLKTLKKLGKAADLSNRAFRVAGPKSYKKGQGALLKVLHRHEGQMSSRELVDALGYDRAKLKDIVRKAQRNGYVAIESAQEKKTYLVKLTDTGEEIAEKRCKAHEAAAEKILETLSDEEMEQLQATADKIVVQCKELGAKGKHKKGRKGHKHGHGCEHKHGCGHKGGHGHHHGHGHHGGHGRCCKRH